jgi:hypothetical protein
MERVYCAVRTESLYRTQINFRLLKFNKVSLRFSFCWCVVLAVSAFSVFYSVLWCNLLLTQLINMYIRLVEYEWFIRPKCFVCSVVVVLWLCNSISAVKVASSVTDVTVRICHTLLYSWILDFAHRFIRLLDWLSEKKKKADKESRGIAPLICDVATRCV